MASNVTGEVDMYLDHLVSAPIKDERALMEFPFFSIAKTPRMEPIEYRDDKVSIRIEPSPKGIATIWDKDLLIYIASLLNDRLERGAAVSREIQFAAYDFLRTTGRGTGKRAYQLLEDTLFRLRATTIVTNVAAGGQQYNAGFGWIESWEMIKRTTSTGQTITCGVKVVLNDWMYRAITIDRRVLSINRDYFRLSMGIERRVYELARKHCGRQPKWEIGLAKLAEKCGSSRETRKIKADLRKIVERDSLPDYRLEIDDVRGVVVFRPRQGADLDAAETVDVLVPDLRAPMAAIEKARSLYPGWDVEALEQLWIDWTRSRGAVIKDPGKAFLAFCARHTRANA